MTHENQWRLEWGENGVSVVDSLKALDQRLDELAAPAKAKPFMAELISPEGNSLALGLGREKSVMSWVSASQDPPYFASKGHVDAEGTIVFYYRGDWSEFPCWSAVPTSTARQAMREFFNTRALPSGVAWEEV
jgi:Immunity protein Imm1